MRNAITTLASKWKSVVAYGLLLFFSYLMLLITIQYIPINYDVALLRIKQDEIILPYYRIAFFTHVYTSMFVLLAGFSQFSSFIRYKFSRLHRIIGKLYISIILLLSGPSGLIMAYHANGGIIAKTAFCTLAILWILFTYKAYTSIRKRDVVSHKNWMYRSYALTLSAVTLRFWKWVIVFLFEPRPMDVYQIVAWLGWTVNLLIAELLILSKRN